MVNEDKKDLIINSLVGQRNNALNALADCESELHIAQSNLMAARKEIEALNEQIKNMKEAG